MDDWRQYLFFPLNDGKTPFFIWLLVPFQSLFQDQLFAGRFVSVLVGLLQMIMIKKLLAKLGAQPKFQWLGMFLVAILPFWYFHAHVTLMDGLLTLFLSMTVWGILNQVQARIGNTSLIQSLSKNKKAIVFTGISLGLAFWTKLPALF